MNNTGNSIAVEIKNSEDLNIDFQQYWFALKRRWLPAIGVSGIFFALGCIGIVRLSEPRYIAQGKILVKPDESVSLTGLLKNTNNQLTPLTIKGNPLKTETEIILSQPVISQVISLSNPVDSSGETLSEDTITQNLEVSQIMGTDILKISYKSTDAQLAASVVNGVMQAYIENGKQVNRKEALTAKQFIAQQLPETQESVRQAEQVLRQFKEKNQVVVIDEEAKLSLETVEKLKTSIAETKANFSEVNAKYRELINKLGMDSQKAIIVAKLSQSEPVQATLTNIQEAEQQLKIERIRFQDNNPTILNLREKIISLYVQLQQRIRTEVGSSTSISQQDLQAGELELSLINQLINLQVEKVGLANEIATLENNLSIYQKRIDSLPGLKEEEREIQRRLDAAQATYETLLTKLKEIEAVENQNVVNARIIENASQPNAPSLDKKIAIFFLGNIAVSLVMFILVIIILENKDVSLKNVKSIQKIFDYPLLASIPTFDCKQNVSHKISGSLDIAIPVRENPTSPISEVYRMLQANLDFIDSDKKPNVILISSSVPQEGKSTVAANLAAVLAESKKKVLLIDSDMRSPSQHHAWDLTNELGLSNVLVGRANISTAVKIVEPHLHILTSGVTPPNPVALLKSKTMAKLIKTASENYEYVIVDAPPILMAADALILGKITNGILMVSRPGVVDSNNATKTKALLEQSAQNILGLVVNGVILKNESDSYYHFKNAYCANNTVISSSESTSDSDISLLR